MKTVLVVGDCHVTNDQNLSRFDVLGNFIVTKKPDYAVFIGDFLTLDSLSAWDKNKRATMEGRRYQKEIDAGNEALDRSLYELTRLQNKQKEDKKKIYKPKLIYIEGNHENRLDRYLEIDPTFSGAVSIEDDLRLGERGIEFIRYPDYYYIDDVGFTHIPFNKIKPISGLDITRKASMVTVDSVVFGHTHEAHLANIHKQGQEHLQNIYCCGCFFEHKDEYVKGCVTQYWVGLSLLTIWKPGRFDVEMYSLSRLKREMK